MTGPYFNPYTMHYETEDNHREEQAMTDKPTLTESDCKVLTELIGEYWLPIEGDIVTIKRQLKRGEPRNHTFTSGNDMVLVKDKIVEMGKWDSFSFYAWYRWWNIDGEDDDPESSVKEMRKDFTPWLINPTTFCRLAAEWWRKESK